MNEYTVVVATIDGEVRWTTKKIFAYNYETDAGGSLHFYGLDHVRLKSFSETSWMEVTFVGTQKEEIGE